MKRFGLWWGTSLVLGLTVVLVPLARARAASAQEALEGSLPQRFTAFAANLGSVRGPAAQTVDIEITRWSTDGERDQLLSVLKERGENALLSALQKLPKVGYLRTPNSLAYDLHFARQHPWGDGGRRVVMATDRYISFWEAANGTRSLQYPFTLIEMRLDHDGNGEGKLSVATKITLEDNNLVLENYSSQPVLLTKVTRQK